VRDVAELGSGVSGKFMHTDIRRAVNSSLEGHSKIRDDSSILSMRASWLATQTGFQAIMKVDEKGGGLFSWQKALFQEFGGGELGQAFGLGR